MSAVVKGQLQQVMGRIDKLICDCGGEMSATGEMLTSNPPQYPHLCKNCGTKENVWNRTYPRKIYVLAHVVSPAKPAKP